MVNDAPGCYGIPSVFSFKSEVCKVCQFNQQCRKVSFEKLKGVPENIHTRNLLRDHERVEAAFKSSEGYIDPFEGVKPRKTRLKRSEAIFKVELNAEQEEKLKTLPKKVAAVASALWRKGFSPIGKENPFSESGNRPYYNAFEAMRAGKVTKKGLRMAFCERMGWSETSAYSEVSIVWSLFPVLGIAREDDDGQSLELIDIDYPGYERDNTNRFVRREISHE